VAFQTCMAFFVVYYGTQKKDFEKLSFFLLSIKRTVVVWKQAFIKIRNFVFCRRKTVLQVRNDMRVSE